MTTSIPQPSAVPLPLVTSDELAYLLATGEPVHLLDVRWSLGAPDGRPAFDREHIPGSVYVDLEAELSGSGEPTDGRHPLPNVADLQPAARRWGLRAGETVVVLDDLNGLSAARAWWLLRWAGLSDVRVLDGGLAGWRRAGLPLTDSAEQTGGIPPGDVVLAGGHLPTLTADQAAEQAAERLLLDVRAAERYRGEVEPIDPRAGHIPGAVSAPTSENLDGEGLLLSADELRRRFTALGADSAEPVGVYCGSGVTAAHTALALGIAGFTPVLFPGSWSAWSSDPGRPVAAGADRNGTSDIDEAEPVTVSPGAHR